MASFPSTLGRQVSESSQNSLFSGKRNLETQRGSSTSTYLPENVIYGVFLLRFFSLQTDLLNREFDRPNGGIDDRDLSFSISQNYCLFLWRTTADRPKSHMKAVHIRSHVIFLAFSIRSHVHSNVSASESATQNARSSDAFDETPLSARKSDHFYSASWCHRKCPRRATSARGRSKSHLLRDREEKMERSFK
jgi:hypothetical protein